MVLKFNLNEPYNDFDLVVIDELLINENKILLSIDLNLQFHNYSDVIAIAVIDESSVKQNFVIHRLTHATFQ